MVHESRESNRNRSGIVQKSSQQNPTFNPVGMLASSASLAQSILYAPPDVRCSLVAVERVGLMKADSAATVVAARWGLHYHQRIAIHFVVPHRSSGFRLGLGWRTECLRQALCKQFFGAGAMCDASMPLTIWRVPIRHRQIKSRILYRGSHGA